MQVKDLFTVDEAARFLSTSRQTVYNAVARGELRLYTVLGRRVLKRRDLERYVPKPPHRPRKKPAATP
jgi:excisionase family DNA binding protein